MVNKTGEWVDDIWVWDLKWRRVRWSWKELEEVQLHKLVESKILHLEALDTWIWKDEQKGSFSELI